MRWTSTYANRGMLLEQVVEITNRQYQVKGQAVIQKISTPVKVTKTEMNGKVHGYWEKKSTVDFMGVCTTGGKSMAIAFDAKETKGKSLSFSNIHAHQMDFMTRWQKSGGEAFLVVLFSDLGRYFRIGILDIIKYINNPLKTNKKSIPLKYFEEHAKEIKKGERVTLDYLKEIEVR